MRRLKGKSFSSCKSGFLLGQDAEGPYQIDIAELNEDEEGVPGATMRISFTNHSKETQSVYIVRRPNGSLTDVELFSKVKIAPEQTVTRASYLEKDEGDFARTLTWCMAEEQLPM